MKPNKKLLMSFMALNAVMSSNAGASAVSKPLEYERLYNKMVKNLELNKSNSKNHKLLEQILNKKNKELQELYIQGDYIVKPEYLEWQIFFSANYEESGNGVDNSSENAKYYSNVTGYYNEEGNHVVTSDNKDNIPGKPYQPRPRPKSINFGVNTPISGVSRDALNLDIEPKIVTVAAPVQKNISAPNPNIVVLDVESMAIPARIQGAAETKLSLLPVFASAAYSTNSMFSPGIGTISSGTYNIDSSLYDSLYTFTTNNETLTFTGKINIDIDDGLISSNSGPVSLTGNSIINDSEMLVNITGMGKGFHSNNTGAGHTDFINNNLLDVTNSSSSAHFSRPFIYGNINLVNNGTINFTVKNKQTNSFYSKSNIDDPNSMRIENNGTINVTGHSPIYYYLTILANGSDHFDTFVDHLFVNNGTINLENATGYLQDNTAGTYDASGGGVITAHNSAALVVSLHANYSYKSNDDMNDHSVLKIGTLNLSGDGIGARATSVGVGLKLGENFPNATVDISDGVINVGKYSHGILIDMENNQTVNISTDINASGRQAVGISVQGLPSTGGMITNTGNITIDSRDNNGADPSMGIALLERVPFTNKGNIYVTSAESVSAVGVYAAYEFTQDGGGTKVISVDGANGVGIYNAMDYKLSESITIKDTSIKVSNRGIGFLSYSNSSTGIILDGITGEASSNGILFSTMGTSPINFLTPSSATIKEGGAAFYISGAQISDIYKNLNNLTLKLEDGSTAFILDSPGTYSIGALPTVSSLGINIDPASGNYKNATISRGTINIDNINNNKVFDLDNPDDALNKNGYYSSNLNLVAGSTIKGTQSGQIAMGQNSYLGAFDNTKVKLLNDGTVSLAGASSGGMYANFGTITNNGDINVTGSDSVGMYGVNGTAIVNSGNILVGNKGVGIYGISGQNTSTQPAYGNKKVNITNNSSIVSTSGTENVLGIYANNNGGTSRNTLTLGTGSNIDVSAGNSGVGIYTENIDTVSTAGSVTVGNNGVGMYANNSNVTLNDFTLNLNGDNALGYYIEGDNSSLSGTGTININGKNVTLFNINSNSPNIDFSTVTVGTITSDSNYTLGNMINGSMNYDSSALLATNGTMLTGKNTNIYLGQNSYISSAAGATGTVGVALDGQYTGSNPITPGIDGKNEGIIELGNSSTGLYGKNGVRFENTGTINLQDDSTGIYAEGALSSAVNTGTILMGSNSQGIYVKDGDTLSNNGSILSSGVNAVGIFAEDVLNPIVNTGIIELSGDKSMGIYKTGAVNTILNNGTVKTGDSSDLNNPSIGIYSITAGDTITNTGTVKAGKNSMGIYTKEAIITQDGTFELQENSIGIYTKSGTVNLGNSSKISVGTNNSVGVYATNGTNVTNNSVNTIVIGNKGYGFVLETGSSLDNYGSLSMHGNSAGIYSDGVNTVNNHRGADINMVGDNNIGMFMVSGGIINNAADIIGTTGKSNIGIYSKSGSLINTGNISVGNSVLVYQENGTVDYDNSGYAVGIYGDNSVLENSGNINIGENGIGIYTRDNTIAAVNKGKITGNGTGATGAFADNGTVINDTSGIITMTGDGTIGMLANKNGTIINKGQIIMSGNNVTAMYANMNSYAENTGTIDMSGATGDSSTAFLLGPGSTFENNGTLILGPNASISTTAGATYKIPSMVNGGIIKTDGVLAVDGISLAIKVNPNSVVYETSTESGPQFTARGTSIIADSVTTTKPIIILPGFADGTNANVYKIENAVIASSGNYEFLSGSLLWEATPELTGTGADVYMERKSFTDFSDDLWFEDFGKALEKNYLGSTGDAMNIYNKTAYIKDEGNFRHVMASLAGNIYANINQRENDITKSFENSLNLLQNSKNNTKENIKINVITGKGKNKEETDGVTGYDYTTTGALALREVERTYKHTFGYSLGYMHTGFEFNDGNQSEEWVDTIQVGVHNKYKSNKWQIRNDITGRVSFHNVDRNVDWPSPLGRSEINGTYETYSVTSDNTIGKEFELGKKVSLMPYGGFRAMYVTRPTFDEKGLESLEVEGNDAWSAKPRAGIEINGSIPLGSKNEWKLKGNLDVAYEYELADLNERENARLTAIEKDYHKLAKPADEKGTIRTRATVGVEVEDRYGIFVTGEYSSGSDQGDDHRVGVTFKAVF